ncbi:MAG: DUF1800 domain-containing protein [Chitinophagaceae bacterium]|jgi:uncharacterized protein (DUF1800 family)|nr:DUF1800 domain-containing protein [Chitinophagaceae bacterium]
MNKFNHFYWRAGFGPTPAMLANTGSFDANTYFDAFLTASARQPFPIKVAGNAVDGLFNGVSQFGQINTPPKEAMATQRQQRQQQSRAAIRSLNLLWLDEMVQSEAQLREKAALFWHGHFACRNLNSFFQQQLLQVIRDGALGNFADLLRAVSQSAAMLAFLNNQQNRKAQPNENFAREVMELFTLGRGHYSETDVKEAARAFTGWGFNGKGEFVFRRQQHDTGIKTILGRKGNFTGDEVLSILLEHPQTAQHLAQKLYRFYVNDTPDEQQVQWLAKRFFQSGYDITSILKDILTAGWMYSDTNYGNRVKSPVEWWVGIRRLLPMDIENPEAQLLLQRALGQVLFYPPTVAGWSGGLAWIDASSLLLRMRMPQVLTLNDAVYTSARQDDDSLMGRMQMGAGRLPNRFLLKAKIDWEGLHQSPLAKALSNLDTAALQALLPIRAGTTALLKNQLQPGLPAADKARKSLMLLMATPEYQLC